MILVDTHCHIYLEQFAKDREEVLKRAAEREVRHIFMPAINLESLNAMEQLAHPRITFHKMAGIHPTEINEGVSVTEEELLGHCTKDEMVAVGETGLDYHWSREYIEPQKESLRLHCRVAREVGKPIILHNRDSTADLLDLIEEEQDGTLKGIWHCFNGTVEEGRRAIDLGLHLGIGGVFTFKNAGVDQAVARLPLEKMVLETDAPYLAPEPRRGKRNEPSYVYFTAKRLAEVMELELDELAQQTTRTAFELFDLELDPESH